MDNVTFGDAVMQEEIFGPVLPVLAYDSLDEPSKRSTPWHILWHYISSPPTKKLRKKLLPTVDSEADVSMTPSSTWQPVRWDLAALVKAEWVPTIGKRRFSYLLHYKSIVDKKTWLDLPMRYQPYRKIYEKLLRKFLK